MLKEFKEFAMRGNVVDLAIGVIIGVAFGGIINSLVGDIIMPVISAVTGGLDFSNHFIPLSKSVTSPVLSEAKKQGPVIGWGNFLTVAVNFLIIAFILFLVVRAIKRRRSHGLGASPAGNPRRARGKVTFVALNAMEKAEGCRNGASGCQKKYKIVLLPARKKRLSEAATMPDLTEKIFAGGAEPLLNILTKVAGERVANSREWPKKPKGLGGCLREAAPNLRKLGMNISFDRTGKKGTRVITLVRGAQSDKGEDASAASDAAANGADTDDINDMVAGRRADTCVSQSAMIGHAQCVSRYLVEKITRPTLPTLPRPTSPMRGWTSPPGMTLSGPIP